MYEEDVLKQKRLIVEMAHSTGRAVHVSPAFAMLEIFNVLLRDVMVISNGLDDESDQLVLSNGHIALGLYSVYVTMGIVSREEFYTYKAKNSRLGVHPDRHYTPGTIISTGSLGHGLPNAVGVAYAWKLKGRNSRLFVTIGDGELNEGTIWESMIFAARMRLDNLCVIVDDNKSTEYMPDIVGKFKAFDWEIREIDGHNENEIRAALKGNICGRPYAIIANTIKGHGVSFIEKNHAIWHEKTVSDDEYELILKEL